jgi:HEAT repeat protein
MRTRVGAAAALGETRDPRAVKPLIAALGEEATDSAVIEALTKIGQAAVKPLVRLLKNDEAQRFAQAAKILAEIRDVRAVKPLIAALGNESSTAPAINALRRIGKPAVEPLIATLKSNNQKVRAVAAEALGLIADSRALRPLFALARDVDPTVRISAQIAINRIRGPQPPDEDSLKRRA